MQRHALIADRRRAAGGGRTGGLLQVHAPRPFDGRGFQRRRRRRFDRHQCAADADVHLHARRLIGGIAGILQTPLIGVSFAMGIAITLKGLAAAILGGLVNPMGAVAGGVILGLAEALAVFFFQFGLPEHHLDGPADRHHDRHAQWAVRRRGTQGRMTWSAPLLQGIARTRARALAIASEPAPDAADRPGSCAAVAVGAIRRPARVRRAACHRRARRGLSARAGRNHQSRASGLLWHRRVRHGLRHGHLAPAEHARACCSGLTISATFALAIGLPLCASRATSWRWRRWRCWSS